MSLQTGGRAVGGYLDEVEIGLLGQSQGVADGDDADLFAVGTDEPDLGYADPVVDAGLGADGASSMSTGCERKGGLRARAKAPPVQHANDRERSTTNSSRCAEALRWTGPDDPWRRQVGGGLRLIGPAFAGPVVAQGYLSRAGRRLAWAARLRPPMGAGRELASRPGPP